MSHPQHGDSPDIIIGEVVGTRTFPLPWGLLAARGAVGVVAGVLLLAWPRASISVVLVLVGLWTAVDGVLTIAGARHEGSGRGERAVLALGGLLAVVIGAIAVVRPFETAAALAWMLGAWLLVLGLLQLVLTALRPSLLGLLTAAAVAAAGFLLILDPGRATTGLTMLIGLALVAWGALFVVVGLLARRASVSLLET
ncbi:DUF308 domain-containing protein [Nocardioides bruguierae]|uniref:DUF308 domain-containing protein n=1 Tax=Nocardioides bruguierae TaxID=2945102 RepID=A0A9X2D7H7_9ACTN|nr:DUF308 domain-containing protein [Nocardioides bruguierae]MCL8026422.1 DUF308 domain-containing protein [Nocardioides bruguierae]MCM0619484.1 DUF308 domain-containing protein [Nocardioides bruguierae]